MRLAFSGSFLMGLTLALGACSPEPAADVCVDASVQCNPIVSPPTFDAIYANIFAPSCASGTGFCHGTGAGGLDMRTADAAFVGLSSRVTPGDVGCSTLTRRLESDSSSFRMPPGPTPLSEPQLCAVRQWIGNGAKR